LFDAIIQRIMHIASVVQFNALLGTCAVSLPGFQQQQFKDKTAVSSIFEEISVL
jgi:hypothetical protein